MQSFYPVPPGDGSTRTDPPRGRAQRPDTPFTILGILWYDRGYYISERRSLMMDALQDLKDRMEQERPACWGDLPDIDLYMDQLISYMPRQLIRFDDRNALTSAMVNNYIKDGLVPRAKGKRYGPIHLGYLEADQSDLAKMALDFALRSYANQLACQRILSILQPQEEKKRKP